MNRIRFSRTVFFVLLAGLLLSACSLAVATPTDPDAVSATWTAQSCPASATAREKEKTAFMDLSGHLSNFEMVKDKAYMLVENATIRLVRPGRVDIDYGGGHKITVYAPNAFTGKMKIERWNGTKLAAIYAGAGKVVENDTLESCRAEILAGGKVKLQSAGTEFVFVVRPETAAGEEVQIAVFAGQVNVLSPDNAFLGSVSQGQAMIVTDGAPSPIFTLPADAETILRNIEQGSDIFGAPQDDYQPAGPRQMVNNLDGLTQQFDFVRLIIPPWEESTIPQLGEYYSSRSLEFIYYLSPSGELLDRLRTEAAAGAFGEREAFLLVNPTPDFIEAMTAFANEMGYTDRLFTINTINGAIEPVK